MFQLNFAANAPYEVKAFMVGGSIIDRGGYGIPAGAGNSGDFKLGDIGFGLRQNETPCSPGSANCLVTSNAVQKDVVSNDPDGANIINGQRFYAANGNLNYVGVGSENATESPTATAFRSEVITRRLIGAKLNWLLPSNRSITRPRTFTDTFKVFITTP